MRPSADLPAAETARNPAPWREVILMALVTWAIALGAVVAGALGLQIVLEPDHRFTTDAALMFIAYGLLLPVRLVRDLRYSVRAWGTCFSFFIASSAACSANGLTPGVLLLLSLSMVTAGVFLGRVATSGFLVAAVAVVYFVSHPIDPMDFNPTVSTLSFAAVAGALVILVRQVVLHIEGSLAAAREHGARLEAEQQRRDATERELAHAREALLQSQKLEALGRLAGGMAHDFNNTLQVILGWAGTAAGGGRDGSRVPEALAAITEAALSSQGMTRQLLAFSRSGMQTPVRLRLGETVQSLADSLRPILPEDVTLAVHLEADPEVLLDRTYLVQILLNLLTNAREAMPDGGRADVSVRERNDNPQAPADTPAPPGGRWAELEVRDTGHGMDEAVMARIFEPFFTTKPEGGSGLGLAAVHGIVHKSGGTIEVQSSPGEGATFVLRFPTAAPAPAPASPPAAPGAARTPAAPAAPARIRRLLLAEDNEGIRDTLARTLVAAGFTVLAAADVPSARALVRSHGRDVDILVTDGVMPGGTAREVIEDYRAVRPDGRVVVCSGYLEEELTRRGLALGDLEFLAKPFAPSELVARLQAPAPDDGSPVPTAAACDRP